MGNTFDDEFLWGMKFTCSRQVLFHIVVTLLISGFSLVNIESLINSLITHPEDILLKVLILLSVVSGT